MELQENEYYRLLEDVLPSYLAALPSASGLPHSTDVDLRRESTIRELRTEIKNVNDVFTDIYRSCSLQGELLKDVEGALELLLFTFDGLADDRITVRIPEVRNINSVTATLFPKLIRIQYAAPYPASFDLEGLISFGDDMRLHRHIIVTARQFKTIMRVSSQVGGLSDPPSVDDSRPSWYSRALDYVESMSKSSQLLLQALGDLVCQAAGDGHYGYLRLDDCDLSMPDMLDFEPLKLHVLLSVCGTDKWQPTCFHVTNSTRNGHQVACLCKELKKATRRHRSSTMRLETSATVCRMSVHEAACAEEGINTVPVQPLDRTLGDIFESEKMERKQRDDRRYDILGHNRKRRLAVEIATAVLYLLDNPLFRVLELHIGAVFVSELATAAASSPRAFLPFRLGLQTATAASHTTIESIMQDGDKGVDTPCFLALAVILLELEMDDKVVVKDDDLDVTFEKPSLYAAAVRYHTELRDKSSKTICNIIDRCLDLALESMDSTSVKMTLFEDVIVPLTIWYGDFRDPDRKRRDGDLASQKIKRKKLPERPGRPECPERPERPKKSERLQNMFPPGPVQPLGLPMQLKAEKDNSIPLSRGSIRNSDDWLKTMDQVNAIVEDFAKRFKTKTKVKIAILDTGCDVSAPCIGATGEARLTGRWFDCAGNAEKPVDDDQQKHGTAVTGLLLRVAKHASVYVIRVAKDSTSLVADNVAKAIEHAATEWDVDIFSMSLGFKDTKRAVVEAMKKANEKRERIFFAASGNEGGNEPERFPAKHEGALSVRGTNHRGKFVYDSPPQVTDSGSIRFGTLAKDVPCECGDLFPRTRSGCSIATPILAGILATVMQYVYHLRRPDLHEALRRKDFILQVMFDICDFERENRRFVAPWLFFERDEKGRATLIENALHKLSRIS